VAKYALASGLAGPVGALSLGLLIILVASPTGPPSLDGESGGAKGALRVGFDIYQAYAAAIFFFGPFAAMAGALGAHLIMRVRDLGWSAAHLRQLGLAAGTVLGAGAGFVPGAAALVLADLVQPLELIIFGWLGAAVGAAIGWAQSARLAGWRWRQPRRVEIV
jgi:hypothetical protein